MEGTVVALLAVAFIFMALYVPAILYVWKSTTALREVMTSPQRAAVQVGGVWRLVFAGALALCVSLSYLTFYLPRLLCVVIAVPLTPVLAFLSLRMPLGLTARLLKARPPWEYRDAADDLIYEAARAEGKDVTPSTDVQSIPPADRPAMMARYIEKHTVKGWVPVATRPDRLPDQYRVPRAISQASLILVLSLGFYPMLAGVGVVLESEDMIKLTIAAAASLLGPIAILPGLSGEVMLAVPATYPMLLSAAATLVAVASRDRIGRSAAIAAVWLYMLAVIMFVPTTYQIWSMVNLIAFFETMGQLFSFFGMGRMADYLSNGLYSRLAAIGAFLQQFSLAAIIGFTVAIWLRFAVRWTLDILFSEEANIFYARRVRVPAYMGRFVGATLPSYSVAYHVFYSIPVATIVGYLLGALIGTVGGFLIIMPLSALGVKLAIPADVGATLYVLGTLFFGIFWMNRFAARKRRVARLARERDSDRPMNASQDGSTPTVSSEQEWQ